MLLIGVRRKQRHSSPALAHRMRWPVPQSSTLSYSPLPLCIGLAETPKLLNDRRDPQPNSLCLPLDLEPPAPPER